MAKPKAMSLVLSAGLIAAFLGPKIYQLSAEILENAEELEPITVTATRFNELVNDVPHDVHFIDEIDILEDMPRSLPETTRPPRRARSSRLRS